MLAVMPLSSPTRFAVPRPAVPGAPAVTRADLGVLAIIGLLALTVVAPAAAIALATAAVVVIALWAGLVASGPAPEALAEAHHKAVALAAVAHYSIAR